MNPYNDRHTDRQIEDFYHRLEAMRFSHMGLLNMLAYNRLQRDLEHFAQPSQRRRRLLGVLKHIGRFVLRRHRRQYQHTWSARPAASSVIIIDIDPTGVDDSAGTSQPFVRSDTKED